MQQLLGMLTGLVALGAGAVASANEHHLHDAAALPRLYEGEILWPCWADSQRIVVALARVEESKPGILSARGIELYLVGRRYWSIDIALTVDLAAGSFELVESVPADRMGEEPHWGRSYPGTISRDLRLLRSSRGRDEEPCRPELLIVAVG